MKRRYLLFVGRAPRLFLVKPCGGRSPVCDARFSTPHLLEAGYGSFDDRNPLQSRVDGIPEPVRRRSACGTRRAEPDRDRTPHAHDRVGQGVCAKRPGRARKDYLREPLRHHARRGPLQAENGRKLRRDRRERTVRGSLRASTRRRSPSAVFSRSRSILPLRARAAASPATWRRPTSTRKISVRRSTISRRAGMSTRNASAFSESAAGVAWRSTPRRRIPVSRRRLPRPCTT